MSQEDPIGADERALLASALAVLPAETRACLWLHCSEGLTVREVAECVGKRHSTVGERIQRGLDLLRRELRRRGLAVAGLDPPRQAFEALARASAPPQSLVEKLLPTRDAPSGSSRRKAPLAPVTPRPILWTGAAVIIAVGTIATAIFWRPSGPVTEVAIDDGDSAPASRIGATPPATGVSVPAPEAPPGGENPPGARGSDSALPGDPQAAPPESHGLRVTVLDDGGNPIAGARGTVQAGVLLPPGKGRGTKSDFAIRPGGFNQTFQTGPDGSFAWPALEPGAYQVEIDTPTYLPDTAFAEIPRTPELVLRLQPAPYLTGRLFLGDREHPLRNSRIEYGHAIPPWNNDRETLDGKSAFETDGEGRFVLDCSGSQTLFRHEWPVGEHTFVFRHERSRVTTIKALFTSERREVPVEVVLERGVTARGVLLTDAGVPIPGTRIRWKRPGAGELARLDCVTGQDGGFNVTGLEPGKYHLAIDGFVSENVLPDGILLTDEAEQALTLSVPCFARLRVRVLDAKGAPVPGVRVPEKWNYTSPNGFEEAKFQPSEKTDADGYVDIICLQQGIPITLGGDRGERPIQPVTITQRVEGETVVLRAAPRGKASGRVVDRQGHAVRGAVVALRGMATRARPRGMGGPVTTDAKGRFEVELSPGRHSLEARAGKLGAGFADDVEPDAAGDRPELQIALGPEDAVRVQVLDPAGRPVRFARVGIDRSDAPSPSSSSSWRHEDTDEEGWVAFGAGPGEYRVKVDEDRGLHHFGVVEGVRPGGEPIEIALEPVEARSITGLVLLDGRPVAGAQVGTCEKNGVHSFSRTLTTSDGDGSFTLNGLEASRLLVVAAGPGFSIALSPAVDLPDRGRVEGVRVEALPGGDLLVKVVDAENKPAVQATVSLDPAEECGLETKSTTNEEGVARLLRVPRGSFHLYAKSADGRLFSQMTLDWQGSGEIVTLTLRE